MADLAGALDAALRARYGRTEVKTPITQRRGLLARMNQLEKRHTQKGDRPGAAGRRAARAAGIAPDTWRRWKAGQRRPSAASLTKIEDAYKKAYTLPALRRALKKHGVPNRVNVTADVRWNGYLNANPRRTVKFGPGGVEQTMRNTIRAWAHQSPDAAALTFAYGLSSTHNVPNDSQGDPGILFEGNDVEIHFP